MGVFLAAVSEDRIGEHIERGQNEINSRNFIVALKLGLTHSYDVVDETRGTYLIPVIYIGEKCNIVYKGATDKLG